jgi:hypothetical protein
LLSTSSWNSILVWTLWSCDDLNMITQSLMTTSVAFSFFFLVWYLVLSWNIAVTCAQRVELMFKFFQIYLSDPACLLCILSKVFGDCGSRHSAYKMFCSAGYNQGWSSFLCTWVWRLWDTESFLLNPVWEFGIPKALPNPVWAFDIPNALLNPVSYQLGTTESEC